MWRVHISMAISLLTLPFMLSAIPADDLKKIEISSNAFHYDSNKGIATYTGNVVATQGSRKLMGDKLEVLRNDHGDIAVIVMHGKPAKHQSLTDIAKPLFFARADTIRYDTRAQYLVLTDNAWIEQAGDEYSAPQIEYDMAAQTVKSSMNPQGRTTIMLKPRP